MTRLKVVWLRHCRWVVDVLVQVRRRSAAERAGVKVGDLVLAINDISTANLTHQQMLELVSHRELRLRLTLSRYLVHAAGACVQSPPPLFN